MKKLLLITFLFTINLTQAQDGYSLSDETYKEIRTKVIGLDSLETKTFADNLASSAKTDFVFYKAKFNDNDLRYFYRRMDLTPEEQKKQEMLGCVRCMVIYFHKYYEGSNEDLGIEGAPKFRFNLVIGSYLDLFPTWKREFLPSAIKEEALDNFKYLRVESVEMHLNVTLAKFSGVWELRNNS